MTPLPDYEEALNAALSAVPNAHAPQPTSVRLSDALNRVLASPVVADRDLPPFNRAQMDGYALRASEFGNQHEWPVVATVSAGDSVADFKVPRGSCIAIATGAPLPNDVDTVIQHERSDRGDQHGKPVRFTIDSIEPGDAVHPRGADAASGQTLVEPGTLLAPHHLGIAAMVGAARLQVARSPRIALLTSGDEVRLVEADVAPHQIRNSNAVMLTALLERLGGNLLRHIHLPDEREATIEAVGRAVNDADLIITVGGVSAGDRDHFPAAFEQHEINLQLRGAAIQPGRPIAIGHHASGTVVAALPGNPVSALVCCCIFVRPVMRRLLGLASSLPWHNVELAEPATPNPQRRAFRPAILHDDGRASVPPWAGSGDLAHTATTAGVLALPVQRDPVQPGEILPFLPWPDGP